MRRRILWAGGAVLAAAVASGAFAAIGVAGEDYSMDANAPLRVEDAQATEWRAVEFQLAAPYRHTHGGEDELTLEPRVKWGFAEHWDVQARVPAVVGSADHEGSGDLEINSQWDFLPEGEGAGKEGGFGKWPGLSAELTVAAPTGEDSAGLDTELELIATKTLSDAPALDRVHLNVSWARDAANAKTDREGRYVVIVGYTRRVAPGLVFGADVLREQDRGQHDEINLAEIGFVWEATGALSFGAAAGLGFGDESPDVTGNVFVAYHF